MIKDNLNNILKEIPNNVTLIAVSKTRTNDEIMDVYNYGIKDFGENKVQELIKKMDELPKDIRWHMIGHLQTNKVKDIVKRDIYLIHSVDSLKLANEINKQAEKLNKIIDILIEINIGNEESKSGISINDTLSFINEIKRLKSINIKGLMCVAPNINDKEKLSSYFKSMRDKLTEINDNNINLLSMGMSNDYQIAIKNGSTMVRIGTAIFGERN